MKDKIGSLEAICLILIIILNHIIIILPKNIISTTSSSSIINIIFITFLALLFIGLINKFLNKFPGYNILNISEFLGGKFLKFLTGICFFIYFIFILSILLRSFCENLKIIYFQNYSITLLVGLFILSIIVCNSLDFKSVIRSNLIIFPISIISILFIFFTNLDNFHYENFFPLLGNGMYTTFFSGISNLFAFSGIAFIYFLPPYLKSSSELKKISYISIISAFLLLIFSVTTFLLSFPLAENSEEIFPLYLVARLIELGRFFQRIDAVFLLIWILSVVAYLSFLLSISIIIFKDLFSIKNSNMIVNIMGLLVFAISLMPKNLVQIRFLENIVYRYFTILLVFIFSFIVLLLAFIKTTKTINNKKGENINEKNL